MILVDTSIWVDHLRKSDPRLVELLDEGRVTIHPFVIGELSLSGLVHRDEILSLLDALPRATAAAHEEALAVVRRFRLDGCGVGWVDVHLFASTLLSGGRLWTADKRLRAVCSKARISYL